MISLTFVRAWSDTIPDPPSVCNPVPNIAHFQKLISSGTIFVTFDREFREVSEHINFHSTELDWIANVADIADSQKARVESDNARMSKLFSVVGPYFAKICQRPNAEQASALAVTIKGSG